MHEPSTLSFPDSGSSTLSRTQALERGRAMQGELRLDDPRLSQTVHMACKDGTNLNLTHAFVQTAGDWVYVFTRDHGYFVEHKDSLATCSSTERPAAL